MRRGHEFETWLGRLQNYLLSIGVHMHKNYPRRSIDGTFISGEPFDYLAIRDGETHCFDAKECEGKRWSLKNAKFEQVDALCRCAKNGAQAYFLVLFKPDRIVRFDAEQVKAALVGGKKSLGAEEGRGWDWIGSSISRSE